MTRDVSIPLITKQYIPDKNDIISIREASGWCGPTYLKHIKSEKDFAFLRQTNIDVNSETSLVERNESSMLTQNIEQIQIHQYFLNQSLFIQLYIWSLWYLFSMCYHVHLEEKVTNEIPLKYYQSQREKIRRDVCFCNVMALIIFWNFIRMD